MCELYFKIKSYFDGLNLGLQMTQELKKWKYDEKTSTYILLRMRRDKGKPLPRLRCPPMKATRAPRPEDKEQNKQTDSGTPTRVTRAGTNSKSIFYKFNQLYV